MTLALGVATIVLWVRSYSVFDIWAFGQSAQAKSGSVLTQRCLAAYSLQGELGCSLSIMRYPIRYPHIAVVEHYSLHGFRHTADPAHGYESLLSPHGFKFRNLDDGRTKTNTEGHQSGAEIAVPYWLIALATLVLPARFVKVRYYRRRNLNEAGQRCLHCGYDLRATPNLCPECGAPTPRS